ncbi:hypothetical protein [Rickettsiella endosymbiont of Miltochrista miniata]|uniref:hypothetical protein n=1 Tax=Rickettsiella endosymbiont of Miltochrista miniata TaxID=3066239 RepID=UPI00313AE65D
MSAIPSNSTTLENIPIEDTSTLEVSSSELIIAADNTNATEGIDTSSEEILSISTAIPPSMSNDTASIAEIDIDLDIGNGMSITEAPTLYNVTDAIDGFRTGRNLDFFPNKLASIIKNDPVAYIERYKLSINTFADEMVNHQQRYGLSECLFEPLQKIGEAFAIVYRQNPQKQALVNRYVQFISDLEKNASSVTRLNCSDTSNWSQTTTTQTPLSSTELTTAEPVTPPVNTTLSPDFTTETLQPTNSTTLRPNLNTTQNSNHDKTVPTGSLTNLFSLGWVSATHGAVAGVVHRITGSIYNYYDSKDRLNGWRKPLAQAGVMLANAMTIATLPAMLSTVENESEQSDPITKVLHSTAYSLGGSLILNGINYAGHKAYYYFNKKPMGKDSIVSKALDALPLAANTGLLINGGYSSTEAMVILGSNLLTAGLSSQVTQSVVSLIVNKTEKNKENDVETGSNNNIPLNNLNTNAVEHAFEQDDLNLDSQFQTLVTGAFASKNTAQLDAFLNTANRMKFFENKSDIKVQAFFLKNLITLTMQNPEIGLYAYNHLQAQERLIPINKNLEANCSIIPLTLTETGNLETHNDKESNADKNTTQLKKLLGSFIAGLKLNSKGFKFESKIFTQNNYSFERINIFYGTNQVLSIFTPEIEQDPANNKFLFSAINQLIKALSKNKSTGNDTYSKFLFVLPTQSATAVIEIVTYPSSSLQKDKISVYNLDNLLKNKLKDLTNNAIKSGYVNSKPEITFLPCESKQHDLFATYYFIKKSVKNYLEICLLPNNAAPDLLEGLLATFIDKLKLTGLEFETEKVNPAENNQASALARKSMAPKNSKKTEEDLELKNGYLVNTIERKRNNAIAACQTTSINNNILSIFKSVPPDSSLARKLSSEEVLNQLLLQRKSEIQTSQIRRDLLPLADERGMAIIEIITSKTESKLIIHDPLGLLADIRTKAVAVVAIAEKNGYQSVYNPNKDYSSDWQSKERCQLAAYYFIKKAALSHLALFEQMNTTFSNNDNLPNHILDEVKHNLSINNEYDMDSLHELKRCDGGVFNLRTYITDVSNYLKILRIETTSLLNNKSDLHQLVATEIQLNLGLTDPHSNLLTSSSLEVITWNNVRFDHWSELFSIKEVTLPQTGIGNVYYLVKFPSDFMFKAGKMAVLAKQENNEHPLLSDIRNFLVYQVTNKPDKIVKKALLMGDLRELFSKFATIQKNNQETRVYSAKHSSFFSVPSSTTVAPVQPSHLMPGYK